MGFEKAFTTKFLLLLIMGLFPSQLLVVIANSEMSYRDLEIINGTCYERDSCSQPRFGDSPGITHDYSCSCSPLCSKLDTCCIDSYHRHVLSPSDRPSCRSVKGTMDSEEVFMVDRCPAGVEVSPGLKSLCEDEWNEDDNVMMLAPVISLFSSVTYKNYYCFRCHELTDDFIFWDLRMRSDVQTLNDNRDLEITYDRDGKTWMATSEENDISVPIQLQFAIPSNLMALVHDCKTDAISRCNDSYTDEDVREKCGAYTAIVYIEKEFTTTTYKNPHCALCNFESLADMKCQLYEEVSVLSSDKKKPFSFTHLIDINRSDGEKVGKLKKCEDNSVWDPYGRKCRKLSCAIPTYIIRNGKCAPS